MSITSTKMPLCKKKRFGLPLLMERRLLRQNFANERQGCTLAPLEQIGKISLPEIFLVESFRKKLDID